MKKIFLTSALLVIYFVGFSQVTTSYYKGEWTEVKKHTLFTCILKISITSSGEAKAETVWTYLAIDSTNKEMREYYQDKEGKSGIAFAEGIYSETTNDLYLEDKSTDDPAIILGFDKYHLKFTANKNVIYGKTETNGTNEGLMYAIKLNSKKGEKEFITAKTGVKE